jgi:hypothetical protein
MRKLLRIWANTVLLSNWTITTAMPMQHIMP